MSVRAALEGMIQAFERENLPPPTEVRLEVRAFQLLAIELVEIGGHEVQSLLERHGYFVIRDVVVRLR
jgi:hypothetical protein